MNRFSEMVFEERDLEGGWREIRIVAPGGVEGRPDVKWEGQEARKRLIRYVFANVSAMVPHLAQELRRECDAIQDEIDYEAEKSLFQ